MFSEKALLENREPGVDYKLVQPAVGALSIAVRDVMKPDADIYRTPFGSEDAQAAACFTNPCESTRVFNRHRLVEIQETAVDVRVWMHFRSIREIELQAERCESRAVRSFATKRINAGGTRRSRNDCSGRDSKRNHIKRVLQRETVIRS